MVQKIKNYICEHIDELTSVKNLYLVFITILLLILLFSTNCLINNYNAAMQYIHELEEAIEADNSEADNVIVDILD